MCKKPSLRVYAKVFIVFLGGGIVGDFDFIIMFDLIFSLIMIIFAFTMIF